MLELLKMSTGDNFHSFSFSVGEPLAEYVIHIILRILFLLVFKSIKQLDHLGYSGIEYVLCLSLKTQPIVIPDEDF